MNHNRLFRNTTNKMLGGVAAGIADYLDTDATIIRVLFVLGLFIPLNIPIVVLYIVLWIVMPAAKPKPWEQGEIRY